MLAPNLAQSLMTTQRIKNKLTPF